MVRSRFELTHMGVAMHGKIQGEKGVRVSQVPLIDSAQMSMHLRDP